MVENVQHHETSIYITPSTPPKQGIVASDTFTGEQTAGVPTNFSYPLCVSQALEPSTLEQTPRREDSYQDGLEEFDELAYDTHNESGPSHRAYVHERLSNETDIIKEQGFQTPSRALLSTWILPSEKSDIAQSNCDSRIRRRRGSPFLSFSPEQLHTIAPSFAEPETEKEVKPTHGHPEHGERTHHQKSTSIQGLVYRPAIPTEHRHRLVRSVDVISRQHRPSHESSDSTLRTPQSEIQLPPMSIFNTDRPVVLLRRGTADILARVDENTAMGQEDMTATPRGTRRPEMANGASPITRSQSDLSPHLNSKKKEGRGSLRRKQKDDVKEKDGKGRWLHKMTDWLTVAEPSTQALKHHKKDVFKRAGIDMDDPQANVKLHVPMGEVPAGAIKPSGPGLDPEDIFKREVEEKKKSGKHSRGTSVSGSRVSQSSSSRSDFSRPSDAIFPFN